MTKQGSVRAVFPGAFDPFTLGHLDVVHRGAPLFGELGLVGVFLGDSRISSSLNLDSHRIPP